jgi:hypothetical protein
VQCLYCYNVAKHIESYLEYLGFNVTSTGDAGCFKKRFTMTFHMFLSGECYKYVYA